MRLLDAQTHSPRRHRRRTEAQRDRAIRILVEGVVDNLLVDFAGPSHEVTQRALPHLKRIIPDWNAPTPLEFDDLVAQRRRRS